MLQINNLVKSFGRNQVLDGLTMEIKQGQIYGLVGPNGAGKTTTIKILAGLLMADSGNAFLDGTDILISPLKASDKVGYMPDIFGIYENLTVSEYMEFFASIYQLQGREMYVRIEEVLELVKITVKKNQLVDTLSSNMKRRLSLARTILHHPKLILLDEPFSGLEARDNMEFQDILRNVCSQKACILLSSHILQDLSDVCTNIGIIEQGKMIVQGDVKSVIAKQKMESPILLKVFSGQETAVSTLKQNPQVSNIASEKDQLSFGFSGTEREQAELLNELIRQGVAIVSYYRNEGNLEEVFLKVTQ